jgi:glycosyltransferase involved in cell wall biosynthesis
VAIGVAWAFCRHFLVACSIIRIVLLGHLRKPSIAIRALYTVTLGCAHARELARHPGALKRTHIHAHYATYPALAAWVCNRLLGIPYSFTAHAHDIYVDWSMLGAKLDRAEFVVAISQFNRMLLAMVPTSRFVPIHVIHCGIDLSNYSFRLREAVIAGPIRALCVASLQEYKGHEFLLQAIAGSGSVARIELDLIGAGPLLGSLRRRAEELGIAARVRFHGARSETQVREALERADLFILPSVVAGDGQMEGIPVALMEALASGVPAISTELSGIPEVLIDRVTGLLAQAGDAKSLRLAIEETITDGAASVERARAGRTLIEKEFALEKTVDELARLLCDSIRRMRP